MNAAFFCGSCLEISIQVQAADSICNTKEGVISLSVHPKRQKAIIVPKSTLYSSYCLVLQEKNATYFTEGDCLEISMQEQAADLIFSPKDGVRH
jgi:hypothetical protein